MNLLIQTVLVFSVIGIGCAYRLKLPLIWLLIYLCEGGIVQVSDVVTSTQSLSISTFVAELLLIYSLVRFVLSKPQLPRKYTSLVWVFVALTLILSIRNNPITTMYGIRWFILPMLAVFPLLSALQDPRQLAKVRGMLVFFVVIGGLITLKQYLWPSAFEFAYLETLGTMEQYYTTLEEGSIGDTSFFVEGKLRPLGLFTGNLINVFFLSLGLNLLYFFFKLPWHRVLLIGSPYLLYLGISLDRSGTALLVLPTLLISVVKFITVKRISLIRAGFIIGGIIVAFKLSGALFAGLSDTVHSPQLRRFTELLSPFQAISVMGRFVYWSQAWDFIRESMLIGYGLGRTIPSGGDLLIAPHNAWMQILLEVGAVCLLLYMMLTYRLLKYIRRYSPYWAPIIALAITVWIFGIFNTALFKTFAIIYALVLALGLSTANTNIRSEHGAQP